MKLVKLDEDKIQVSGQGNTKFIRMRSGQPEEDDFDELVDIMDLLFDSLVSTKYKHMFKTNIQMSKLKDVRKRFDHVISEIRKKQSEINI